MAIVNNNPGLKIHKRSEEKNLKKVMVYGLDKSGKSTFVEKYCKENGLKAVVIDIDDTNYTDMDLITPDTSSAVKTQQTLINSINMIQTTDYDTIVIDGVSSLLEHLTGVGKGMNIYSDRSKSWNMILRKLKNCGKHLIFVGQIDMRVDEDPSTPPSKAIIHVNSMVNEKYYCYTVTKDKKKEYLVETEIKRE